jgi:hypothetical protein
MSLLVSALSSVLVSLFSAMLFTGATPSPSAEPSSPGEDARRIEGLVTVNGDPAPAGIRVTVSLAEDEETTCGDFVTGGGATTFQLILPDVCGPGSVAQFRVDTGDQSEAEVEITEERRAFSTTVDFQLSASDLTSLGVSPDGASGVAVVSSNPLTGMDLYVVVFVTVLPAIFLLGVMVLMVGLNNRGHSTEGDSSEASRQRGNYRSQIEGMVLVMVVLAVILLGVTDKIGSDGLVSVLAAIVGYTVGRHVTRGST